MGGAVVKWLRDEMKMIHESGDSEFFARKVKDSGGVYFVPAFSGLGAPHWDMEARGTIVGLTAGTGKNHIIRGALESIAYQTEDVISAMNEDMALFGEEPINCLKVDGGASANDLLMQMQSDISGISVMSFSSAEATALGAAFLAGLGVGFFKDREELKEKITAGKVFECSKTKTEREKMLKGWQKAVKACKAFSEED